MRLAEPARAAQENHFADPRTSLGDGVPRLDRRPGENVLPADYFSLVLLGRLSTIFQ